MQIVRGVHQLKVSLPGNPLGFVNSYLIRDGEGCLLLDTGWDSDEAFLSLEAELPTLGVTFEDIADVVVAHAHPDHYGLAGRIKQVSPATLAFHGLEKALVESIYAHRSEARGARRRHVDCPCHRGGS